MSLESRSYALDPAKGLIRCPVCKDVLTEYDERRSYICPECGETGFSPSMTAFLRFHIRR